MPRDPPSSCISHLLCSFVVQKPIPFRFSVFLFVSVPPVFYETVNFPSKPNILLSFFVLSLSSKQDHPIFRLKLSFSIGILGTVYLTLSVHDAQMLNFTIEHRYEDLRARLVDTSIKSLYICDEYSCINSLTKLRNI